MKILRKAMGPFLSFMVIFVLFSGCAGKPGATGIGVSNASVNNSGHLILTLSNGATLDAGNVVGPVGATGSTGATGAIGATGPAGSAGPAGPAGSSGSSGTGGTLASVSSLITKLVPTMVFIDVNSRQGEVSGTGVIISSKGYILTAYHVTSGGTTINVTLSDATTIPATFVAGLQGRDYAIIKLNSVPASLSVAALGSSTASGVGDYVVSGGFALGYTPNPSFSFGIISSFRKLSDGYNYVQTDAAINPGDSGGPLINMAGQVIGINDSADVYDDNGDPVMNMAYCLPIDEFITAIQAYVGG